MKNLEKHFFWKVKFNKYESAIMNSLPTVYLPKYSII